MNGKFSLTVIQFNCKITNNKNHLLTNKLMPSRKTTTQNKPKPKIDIKDTEKPIDSEIRVGEKVSPEASHQTFHSSESSNRVGTWWFIEIWEENREIFKTLIEHPLFFSIPILSLFGIDFIIKNSSLSDEKKHILEELDFYGIIACLGILTISFIIKLIILTVRGIKNGH